MKPHLFAMPIVMLATFAIPALSVSAQADPMPIVQQFIDARNNWDEPGAMALVADEINYVEGSACPLANPCTGAQALRTGVQAFISDHSHSSLIPSPSISGTTVSVRVVTSNDAVRAVGLDRIVYDYIVDVQDGKLTSFRGILDATDPQTAVFDALQPTLHLDTPALATSAGTLAVAPTRDDWRLASNRITTAHAVAPPTRDDWPWAGSSTTP